MQCKGVNKVIALPAITLLADLQSQTLSRPARAIFSKHENTSTNAHQPTAIGNMGLIARYAHPFMEKSFHCKLFEIMGVSAGVTRSPLHANWCYRGPPHQPCTVLGFKDSFSLHFLYPKP